MKIDYIIQNHVEKDHSGALSEIHAGTAFCIFARLHMDRRLILTYRTTTP
jgi:flavorubredoxin